MTDKELENANIIYSDLLKLREIGRADKFTINDQRIYTPWVNEKISKAIKECYETMTCEFEKL